jgi:sugar transferase EpsL
MSRLMDLVISVVLITLALPLLGLVALAIFLNMGKPIFFRQLRPGLDGHPFHLLKFRTMSDACDEQGQRLPGQQRLTRLGLRLRSLSLDELPQLINVLRGEMSLVGPRPLLMDYVELYTPEQKRRMKVKPGITGWAQVNGRNALSWEEKFALDVWYVDHQSLGLDLQILWLTLVKVVRREGITTQDGTLAQRFTGSPREASPEGIDSRTPPDEP